MDLSIGIDISKDYFDVAIYENETFAFSNYHYTKKGIDNFIKAIKELKGKDFLITMEATGVYHLKLATLLYTKGFQVSVVNPLIIKRFAQMKMKRVKTDKADSKIIAEYGYYQKSNIFVPKNEERERIELILAQIDDFISLKNQTLNRLESLRHRSIKDKERIKDLKDTILFFNKKIVKLENESKKIIKIHFSKESEKLNKIPGIGERTSSAIIAKFDNFKNFENGKQVASFIGICPCPNESGSSIKRRGNISKKGNSYLRKIFYMAALSASRYNPNCRNQYNRLIQKGKPPKLALIAVANKLAKISFAILKNDRVYNVNYKFVKKN